MTSSHTADIIQKLIDHISKTGYPATHRQYRVRQTLPDPPIGFQVNMKIVAGQGRFITSACAPISNNLVTFMVRAYLVHTGGFGIEGQSVV